MKTDRKTLESRMALFSERCAEAGLRLTPQRLEVYRELVRTDDHPSVEMIHRRVRRRLPTITPDTIYRTLNTLEKSGLVIRVSVVENSARFEANIESHHHFVCRICGTIRDVYSEKLNRLNLSSEMPDDFQVDSAQIELRGICPDCAKRPEPR